MGAYVSKTQCERLHSLNCNVTDPNSSNIAIGGHRYGEFEPNPDVAGIGVLVAFFSIACLALTTSALYLIIQLTRFMGFTGVDPRVDEYVPSPLRLKPLLTVSTTSAEDHKTYRTTWADIFEAIILSCSDQQVFTSGAYALALRYAQGCSVSAYHYNIVANMMLITSATHLMSVTVVSQYWKHKLLAIFRTLLISGLYVVTALLLTNQSAGPELPWPADPPKDGTNNTLLVLPAACFQGDKSTLNATLVDTFGRGTENAKKAILKSSPNNRIVGWNFFILIILWYGAAIIAEIFRYCCRRATYSKWIGRAFWVYQFVGATFCIVAIASSYRYIQGLRRWMDKSPWIRGLHLERTNPENDAKSFGQFVPLTLILLTVFTVLQLMGDKFSDWRRGTTPDLEASRTSSSQSLPEKKSATIIQATPLPPTPPSGSNKSQYQSRSSRSR